MTNVTNTSILSIFTLIRSAIIANSTLNAKFTALNIHQFEPKHKGVNVDNTGFPYIWIKIPKTEVEKLVFDNSVVPHDFNVSMFMRMDWEAKDNVLSYCNAMLKAIADHEDTFEDSGYYDVMIELIEVDDNQIISQKQIVESEFLITFQGQVKR